MKKRERHPKQGWAKHRRNLDGGARFVQKKLRRRAKEDINVQKEENNHKD